MKINPRQKIESIYYQRGDSEGGELGTSKDEKTV